MSDYQVAPSFNVLVSVLRYMDLVTSLVMAPERVRSGLGGSDSLYILEYLTKD